MKLRRAVPLALATALLVTLPLAGRATTPSYFPTGQTLDTTSYSLRVSGADRFSTAAALARVSAVNVSTQTGYPFNEADSTEQGKAYGFGNCPKAVGVAAGDTVADALAASPIKDLGLLKVGTGASAVTIDTSGAVMLLTPSARDGATTLADQTRDVLQEIKQACGGFDAVIFGGTGSVPEGAEDTLKAIATRVVRIEGADRFETAAKIADAVFNASGTPTVAQFSAFNTKTDNVNSIFLLEGITGADALAVGPFAASKNVPVVLTATDTLPKSAQDQLIKMSADTIYILGGTGAVSDAVEKQAAQLSGGAKVIRIAGDDRYQTSTRIAQQLYNLFTYAAGNPVTGTPNPDRHSNVGFGFARSEGSGATHTGFPDALASAWFLDSFFDRSVAPERVAPAIERNRDTPATAPATGTVNTMIGGTKANMAAPLLLVRQADAPSVADYVKGLYPEASAMRTATQPTARNHGGFGFVFGGDAAVSTANVSILATNLSGGTYTEANQTDLRTSVDNSSVFYTSLDYTGYTTSDAGGVDAEGAFGPGSKVCALRKAMGGSQFLSLYEVAGAGANDLFGAGQKVDYQDASTYPQFESRFQCVDVSSVAAKKGTVLAVGPTGRKAVALGLDWSVPEKLLTTESPGSDTAADTAGTGDVTTDPAAVPGGPVENEMTFSGPITIVLNGVRHDTATYRLTVKLTRTTGRLVVTTGSIALQSGTTNLLTANIKGGEAATLTSPLRIAGMYESGNRRGGIKASISRASTGVYSLSDLVVDGSA